MFASTSTPRTIPLDFYKIRPDIPLDFYKNRPIIPLDFYKTLIITALGTTIFRIRAEIRNLYLTWWSDRYNLSSSF